MVTFDAALFGRRLAKLVESFKTDPAWAAPDGARPSAFALAAGASSDEFRYRKTTALHLWLLTYELPDTFAVLTPTQLHISTSAKKVALLTPLTAAAKDVAGVDLVLHARAKGADGAADADALIAAAVTGEGRPSPPLLAVLAKDVPAGPLGDAWTAAVARAGVATADAAPGVAAVFATKDAAEVAATADAAALAVGVLTRVVVPQLETVIDEERAVKHAKLAARAERALGDPAAAGVPLPPSAGPPDAAFPPIIQSGGVYDLRLSAASDDRPLAPDVVTVALGARSASYCAIVGRTYLVEPDDGQEAAYGALAAAHAAAVGALVEGAPLSAAHAAATAALAASAVPSLAPKLGKSVGAGIGLEVRESARSLTASAAGTVAAGATFCVSVGVAGLDRGAPVKSEPGADAAAAPTAKPPYAIYLADTVVVQPGGAPPRVLTAGAASAWGDVAYELGDGDDDGDGADADDADEVSGDADAAAKKRTLRSEADDGAAAAADRARARAGQDALLDRINQQTLAALSAGGAGAARGGAGGARRPSDAVAYRSPADVPAPPTARIAVDGRAEAVLVPLYGATLPLHILTIKNATHTADGGGGGGGDGAAYVRLALGCGAGYEPAARHPALALVKELAFRVADAKAAARAVAEIKALRAAVAARDKETAERATLVAQEKLVKAAGRPPALPDVWCRPALGGKGRRVPGTLEAHANGFRYASPRGEALDVMYRNIKHAFFQPADGEAITLVHFHLVNPIMVGKKKTHDVQFYTEVVDAVHTLDGGRRSAYDPDEIEEEQRERELRARINRAYQTFVKRVQQDVWTAAGAGGVDIEFEVPFRELGFTGVPHRAAAYVQPTVNCLVELIEMPFTVITLADIIVVNLERVGFGLRNFDMTLVKRDLSDAIRIDAIPMKSLDTIKEWLASIDVKFYESKINLQWPAILKSIREDPEGFVESGGWDFLDAEGDDGDEESDDGDEEFEPSEDSDDDDDDDDDSDDSDASLEDEDESDDDEDGDADLSDDERGLSWDELEREAARADRKHGASDASDDDDRRAKKKKARR